MNGYYKPLTALLIAMILAGIGWFVHDVYREIDQTRQTIKDMHQN